MRKALIVLLAAACVGCSKEKPEDEVIFRVNGETYTQADYERETAFQKAMFAEKNEGGKQDENRTAMEERGIGTKILLKKIDEMLLLQHIAKKNYGSDKVIMAGGRAKYSAVYGGRKKKKYDEIKASLDARGGYGKDLDARLEREAATETFMRKEYGADLAVTDKEVQDTIESMKRGDARAAETNKVIYATATNVWKKAVAGADFASLARQHSDDESRENGGDMGDNCDATDFNLESPEVWQAISKLKEGEILPPTSTSEGLVIIKCYKREADAKADGGYFLHLGRIVFHRALTFESYDASYVKRALKTDKRKTVVEKLLGDLTAKAAISAGPAAKAAMDKRCYDYIMAKYKLEDPAAKREQGADGKKSKKEGAQ